METKIISLHGPAQVAGPASLFDLLTEYRDYAIQEKQLKPGTVIHHNLFINGIKAFLLASGYETVPVTDVRIKHMEELRLYILRETTTKTQRHASRHLEYCRRVCNYAVKMGLLAYNPIAAIETKRDKKREVVSLTAEELKMLQETKFQYEKMDLIRDLFLFQCWTGMSYADLWHYQITEQDGRKWIKNQRQKNLNPYFVPLFPEAERIHHKYKGKLPYVWNQDYNRLLKAVMQIAGINKRMTSHCGRKSFASLRDAEGWSPRSIATMLGNTIAVCERHYLADSTKRIENELDMIERKSLPA